MAKRETRTPSTAAAPYPPVGAYGFLSDCHSAALVSPTGSIDWCCMPRLDAGSVFGRLLDWERGGHCTIAPTAGLASSHEYLGESLVLATTFSGDAGEARLIDCFSMRPGGRETPLQELIRVVEGVRGVVDFELRIACRFDYGALLPWIRHVGPNCWAAIGGADGLFIWCDEDLELRDRHDLQCRFSVRSEERVRLVLRHRRPELLDARGFDPLDPHSVDERLEATLDWWRRWAAGSGLQPAERSTHRSALVLKGLANAPTGAIAAAATTSLPACEGGARNRDDRVSRVRDCVLSARLLAQGGHDREADAVRRFIQRSSAGGARQLQVVYGVGGERRLRELELGHLEGYRGVRPVRLGSPAAEQLELDAYGELLLLAWTWHRRGESPDDDYWRFLVDLVDLACERWPEPDHGIWGLPGRRHFVHSKVMCWAAVDRGAALADECMRRAPTERWRQVAGQIREAIDGEGVDPDRGCFVQAFDARVPDSSLLLIPATGFCAYDDERMTRTVGVVRAELEEDGLLLPYRSGGDGAHPARGCPFPACSFWLAECLAGQGELEEARAVFERAAATSTELGLFGEAYGPRPDGPRGNLPHGPTHLAHLAAAIAISGRQPTGWTGPRRPG